MLCPVTLLCSHVRARVLCPETGPDFVSRATFETLGRSAAPPHRQGQSAVQQTIRLVPPARALGRYLGQEFGY